MSPLALCIAVKNLSFSHLDPATLEELATVPDMGLEETKEAIDAAARAFPSWSATTPKVSVLSLHLKAISFDV